MQWAFGALDGSAFDTGDIGGELLKVVGRTGDAKSPQGKGNGSA